MNAIGREGVKCATEIARLILTSRIFTSQKFSLIHCRFSLRSETAFSAMKKLETYFIAENYRRFKNSVENAAAAFNFEFLFARGTRIFVCFATENHKNSFIDCDFLLRCKIAFSRFSKIEIFENLENIRRKK